MIQFLKNIWYAQRNAEEVKFWKDVAILADAENYRKVFALMEIAQSNPKNTNGTVRKHVRIARDALGWRR